MSQKCISYSFGDTEAKVDWGSFYLPLARIKVKNIKKRKFTEAKRVARVFWNASGKWRCDWPFSQFGHKTDCQLAVIRSTERHWRIYHWATWAMPPLNCQKFHIGLWPKMQPQRNFPNSLKYYMQMCRKITKTVATCRCEILRLKCIKFDFGWGSAPDRAGELTAPQTS